MIAQYKKNEGKPPRIPERPVIARTPDSKTAVKESIQSAENYVVLYIIYMYNNTCKLQVDIRYLFDIIIIKMVLFYLFIQYYAVLKEISIR